MENSIKYGITLHNLKYARPEAIAEECFVICNGDMVECAIATYFEDEEGTPAFEVIANGSLIDFSWYDDIRWAYMDDFSDLFKESN